MPRLACPECRTMLLEPAADRVVCDACTRVFERHDGVWRFLTPMRRARLDRFIRQYRLVRDRDGHPAATPEHYRRLPSVAADDPRADEWRIRRETYHHLLRHVLAVGPQPLRVLDVGAGSGWLSHRLAAPRPPAGGGGPTHGRGG